MKKTLKTFIIVSYYQEFIALKTTAGAFTIAICISFTLKQILLPMCTLLSDIQTQEAQ